MKKKIIAIAVTLSLALAVAGAIMYGGQIGDPPPQGSNVTLKTLV